MFIPVILPKSLQRTAYFRNAAMVVLADRYVTLHCRVLPGESASVRSFRCKLFVHIHIQFS